MQPYWDEATYNTAKAALAAFVKNISYEEAKHGILCNTVSPAFIETDMTDGMMEKRAKKWACPSRKRSKSFLDEERPGIALKRRGRGEEVASRDRADRLGARLLHQRLQHAGRRRLGAGRPELTGTTTG